MIRRPMLVVGIALLLLAPFASALPSSASATSAADQGTLAENVVYIVQGETDLLPGHETADDFYLLHIMTFDLPYNVSRVYTNVPRDARNLSVMSVHDSLSDWSEPAPSTTYYIDVPSQLARQDVHKLSLDSLTSFSAGGSYTHTTYESGSLHLIPGNASGTYLSGDHLVPNSHSAISGNISISGTDVSNVSSEVSNDGGATWITASPGTNYTFPGEGSVLKLRLTLTGNETTSPTVTSVTLYVSYGLAITPFTVHVSYLWSPTFTDRVASIDLGEVMPYSPNGTIVLMAYLVKGYVATADGLNLRFDSTGSMNTYPDKDLYLNMTPLLSTNPVLKVYVTAPAPSSAWTWYALAGALALVIGVSTVFVLGRRKSSGAPTAADSESPAVPQADLQDNKNELIARKKALLAEMDALRAEGTKGKPKAERAAELARLHREYKSVRNDLNRISRVGPSVASADHETTSMDYESSLAAIARLDADFEAKRLPEVSYKSMRKRYLERAAVLKADLDGTGPSAEKGKLMEAIAALDEEHEQGLLDENVYKDLRASYAKELAEVMRKADEGTDT